MQFPEQLPFPLAAPLLSSSFRCSEVLGSSCKSKLSNLSRRRQTARKCCRGNIHIQAKEETPTCVSPLAIWQCPPACLAWSSWSQVRGSAEKLKYKDKLVIQKSNQSHGEMKGLVRLTFFQWMLTNFSWAMKVQSGTEHYQREDSGIGGLDKLKEKWQKRWSLEKEKKRYLDMLRDVFVILFLVFKGPVTGVAKMRKLWLFLVVLLRIAKRYGHQIEICASRFCDKSKNFGEVDHP